MDIRTLTKLLLKLAGLYLLITVWTEIPLILNTPHEFRVGSVLYAVSTAGAGLLLLWLTGGISNQIIRIGGLEEQGAGSASSLLRVGCILLGLYSVASAIYGLVFELAQLRLFYHFNATFPGSPGPPIGPPDFATLTAKTVELLLGLALWLGSKYVLRFSLLFDDRAAQAPLSDGARQSGQS